MNKIKRIGLLIFGLPKTLYINFRLLPIQQAIKLPIWIAAGTELGPLGDKGILKIDNCSTGVVKLGFSGSFDSGRGGYCSIQGYCHFKGRFSMGRGFQFVIGKNSCSEFGNDFTANANCIVNSNSSLVVGNDFLAGWSVTVLDGDGHKVLPIEYKNEEPEIRKIFIGNHVWVASDVKILKGAQILDNSIVASNAIITKRMMSPNILIGGSNKILKENVTWEI